MPKSVFPKPVSTLGIQQGSTLYFVVKLLWWGYPLPEVMKKGVLFITGARVYKKAPLRCYGNSHEA